AGHGEKPDPPPFGAKSGKTPGRHRFSWRFCNQRRCKPCRKDAGKSLRTFSMGIERAAHLLSKADEPLAHIRIKLACQRTEFPCSTVGRIFEPAERRDRESWSPALRARSPSGHCL